MAARTRKDDASQIYEIEITLLGSRPRIWRRVAVPATITLADLHIVVQYAMGWTNSHLHEFVTTNRMRYHSMDWGEDPDPDAQDEATTALPDILRGVGDQLGYEYDFGDGWEHRLKVVKVGPPVDGMVYPRCLAGRGACPPEDCGGIYGYYELLEVLADPENEDHEEMTDWVDGEFDPDHFDLVEVNEVLTSLFRPGPRLPRVLP